MELIELKERIKSEINDRGRALEALSRKIHDNPETGMNEVKAAGWLTEFLESAGFRVERGTGNLPTAWRAVFGSGKPVIAFLAEYDALPRIGHACGHNIIATAAVGAGIAAKMAVTACGGTVQVIGTPDEEVIGGKELMVRAGVFNDVDAALMLHPDTEDNALIITLACQNLHVEFSGQAAHAASAPEQGINALGALILAFNGIDALRQHIKDKARIHGIITDGGEAANIVPAHSAADFTIRAGDRTYLETVKGRVLDCFQGAAMMTGARLTYTWGDVCYAAMKNNDTLARLYRENMAGLGRPVKISEDGTIFSTDMANVSRVVPSLHAMVKIAPPEVKHHTPAFAAAAVSEAGMKALREGATALALTAADLLADPKTRERVRQDFTGTAE